MKKVYLAISIYWAIICALMVGLLIDEFMRPEPVLFQLVFVYWNAACGTAALSGITFLVFRNCP